MAEIEPLFVGKTFDDFLFRPQHSPVRTRREVSLAMPLVPGLALERTATIAEARQLIRKHNASSFLIEEVKGSGRLAGILSHRDMPLDAVSDARPVSAFMTPRQRLGAPPPPGSPEA